MLPSLYSKLVSYPDSHVHPPEKRVWSLSKDFLVVLSQHVRKTGKPIRTLVRNKSCDIKTRSEHRPIPGSWNRSHYSRGCKSFRLREREQQCSKNAALANKRSCSSTLKNQAVRSRRCPRSDHGGCSGLRL